MKCHRNFITSHKGRQQKRMVKKKLDNPLVAA
jgi:hypothetical protein